MARKLKRKASSEIQSMLDECDPDQFSLECSTKKKGGGMGTMPLCAVIDEKL